MTTNQQNTAGNGNTGAISCLHKYTPGEIFSARIKSVRPEGVYIDQPGVFSGTISPRCWGDGNTRMAALAKVRPGDEFEVEVVSWHPETRTLSLVLPGMKRHVTKRTTPTCHSRFCATGTVAITRERVSFVNATERIPTPWAGCLVDAELANDIVRCFTFADGVRALDCSKAFRQVRKLFGANFDFVFGFPADDDFKFGLADALGDKIRSFVLNGRCAGIEAFDRADGGKTLVVATGKQSLRFDMPIFMRFDVRWLENGPGLELDRILFTDREGYSIAGIADIPDRIWYDDVRRADRAFRETLGKDYDVFGVNASLYETWDEADSKGFSEFSVDLSEFQEAHGSGTTICRFTRRDEGWHITLVVDGEESPLGEIVGNCAEFVADPQATEQALAATRCAFARFSLDNNGAFVDFRHIFDEKHLVRFSDAFARLVRKDYNLAKSRFQGALRVALVDSSRNPESWMPFFYHAGSERNLLVGARIDSEVALLIPLYLTDEDSERKIPSTYLVACAKETSEGLPVCAFPTVLSARQAEMNHRYFRRAVSNGLRAA